MKVYPFALSFLISFTAVLAKHSELPLQVDNFLGTYCLDCHDSETRKGEVSLDLLEIDWTDPHSAKIWGRVFEVIESGEMPPEKKKQPSDMEIQEVSNWLSHVLLENDKPGGTVLRRLSKDEYEKSVSSLFKIPFTVPSSFPSDLVSHGFDNHGEDLVLSPTLMAEYLEIATAAADRVLPPPRQKQRIDEQTITISPRDFTLNFTTGYVIDDVLRMVNSSDPLARGSVWPNRFEAKVAGIYRVKVDLSYFKPVDGHVPEVHLLSHQADGNNFARASELKKLAEFKVPMEKASTFVAEVELQPGETIVIHYENAALHSDQTKDQSKHIARVSQQLIDLFRGDHELGAAWMKAGYVRGDRGWGWLEKIEAIRQEGGLDIEGFDPESSEVKKFASLMSRQPLVLVETMCCYHFSKGPGLNVHRMSISGPVRLVEDERDIEQRKITNRFLGERKGRNDREYAEAILRPLVNAAFRRPATDAQVEKYLNIALNHQADGHRFEDGIHLALRAVLCSPNFLYRGQREGKLDDYDLAARLSFFLTSAPPDTLLQKLASKGQLSQPAKLEEQTRRLLNDRRVKNFLTSFTDQWLDLNVLPDIMPDSRLLNWNEKDLAAIIAETELFVAEILRENHPIETFIDPSFTYLNKRNAKLYNIKFPNSDTMARVDIKPGGRHGGILGQASVMMATANGVDTQPVLRGVWLLENVLGDPVPEPPPEVPAVEPDTSGAKSIRDLLQKHNADPSCAGCHKKIDPPGFALENFDPVGRWRDFYPVYEKVNGKVVRKDGLPVDAVGTMLDGTELRDVTDLKSYLVKNIDIFGNCLAEKLLVYATGRDLGFTERKEVEKVVKNVRQSGNGFQDLIVALVLSESFQTK